MHIAVVQYQVEYSTDVKLNIKLNVRDETADWTAVESHDQHWPSTLQLNMLVQTMIESQVEYAIERKWWSRVLIFLKHMINIAHRPCTSIWLFNIMLKEIFNAMFNISALNIFYQNDQYIFDAKSADFC